MIDTLILDSLTTDSTVTHAVTDSIQILIANSSDKINVVVDSPSNVVKDYILPLSSIVMGLGGVWLGVWLSNRRDVQKHKWAIHSDGENFKHDVQFLLEPLKNQVNNNAKFVEILESKDDLPPVFTNVQSLSSHSLQKYNTANIIEH